MADLPIPYAPLRESDIYGHFQIHRQEKDLAATITEFNETIPDIIRKERREGSILFQGSKVANPNQPVRADTEMDLGGLKVQILLTPGHTPTNISVFVPADGVLFSGDCVVNDYLPNLAEGSKSDWRSWQESLERIKQLNPEVIIPGHGAVIVEEKSADQISRMLAFLDQALQGDRHS